MGGGAGGRCVQRVRRTRHLQRSRSSRRFLTAILEQGGSRDAMEAFVEFRGRKPQIEPLLKQLGLAA